MAKRSSTWDSALAPFRHLIIAQGEVGYAYNLLQEAFFNIFNLTMALERPASPTTFYFNALTIWHVNPGDRVQRQLALAAIEGLPTKMDIKGGIARLKWAKQQTDDLAEYRNLIIHAPMRFRYPLPKKGELPTPLPGIGGASTKPVNMRRLRLIKSQRFWKTLRNDFLNLSDYVEFVGRQIGWREYERLNGPVVGASHAWPRKPKLASIRIIRTLKSQTAPSPTRRPRRRPSRGRPQG
jgi:hypothetical protein